MSRYNYSFAQRLETNINEKKNPTNGTNFFAIQAKKNQMLLNNYHKKQNNISLLYGAEVKSFKHDMTSQIS